MGSVRLSPLKSSTFSPRCCGAVLNIFVRFCFCHFDFFPSYGWWLRLSADRISGRVGQTLSQCKPQRLSTGQCKLASTDGEVHSSPPPGFSRGCPPAGRAGTGEERRRRSGAQGWHQGTQTRALAFTCIRIFMEERSGGESQGSWV